MIVTIIAVKNKQLNSRSFNDYIGWKLNTQAWSLRFDSSRRIRCCSSVLIRIRAKTDRDAEYKEESINNFFLWTMTISSIQPLERQYAD